MRAPWLEGRPRIGAGDELARGGASLSLLRIRDWRPGVLMVGVAIPRVCPQRGTPSWCFRTCLLPSVDLGCFLWAEKAAGENGSPGEAAGGGIR